MQTFGSTDFFFYLTTDRKSIFFPIRFKSHNAFMLLLNFFGKPEVWGDNERYSRMGQDKFYRLSEKIILDLEDITNIIKNDKRESHSKTFVNDLLCIVKEVGVGKYIAITRFCSPEFKINNIGRIQLCNQVVALNSGMSISEADKIFEANYKPFLDIYDVDFFGGYKQTIGKSENRTCRFCGRKEKDGVKFGNSAHAIPAAVGNSLLFCNEECNDCNHQFGEKIETDFTNFFHINRALYKIKNRSKNIYIGENFCIDHDQNFFVDGISKEDKAVGTKQLICKETITNNSLYRSLVKFVINLIDERYLPQFVETIQWIKGTLIPVSLPPVMTAMSKEVAIQPTVQIFTRKTTSSAEFPYCITLLHCIDRLFLFIVPLALPDQQLLNDENLFKRFFPLISPFLPSVDQWFEEDYGTTDPRYVWRFVDVNVLTAIKDLQAKKNELHSPKKKYSKPTYFEFPPFSPQNVTFINHSVLRYKEYCPYSEMFKEEYINSNLINGHKLFINNDGTIRLYSIYECKTNKDRKMFDYEQIDTFRLKDPSLSIDIDENSCAIDIYLIRELFRRVLETAHLQLNDVYHQHLQLYPEKDSSIDYAIYHIVVRIELQSGKIMETTGSNLWNLKYLHI